jgi:NADP-dependent 3-hydroxy acid dehydrogenase YdfG
MSSAVTLDPAKRPVVVSGASSGIGEATARMLGEIGHPVVLGARRVEACERIAAEIRAAGGVAHAAALDLGDAESITAFAKQAEQLVGPIDVLVSNAGSMQPGDAMTAERESLEHHLNVNVVGTRSLAQAVGAGMIERHRGDLVFVTSEVLRAPRPGIASYVASKFAVEGLIAALQMELEGSGVRVSSVRPGQTMTEMGWDWDPAVTTELLTSWQQWGLARHSHFMAPSDVAAAVSAVVGAPPGVAFTVVEVEPVRPFEEGR